MKTNFGILKELKEGETRVALTPDTVGMLISEGLSVSVESGAGSLSGFDDEQYEKVGAKVLQSAAEVWEKSNIIVKVKEPQKCEYQYFREDLVIFSYLHLAVEEELTRELLKKKVCAIASEAVETQWGELSLLRPMSEVAGRMSVQLGARFLEKQNGGRGLLLGGVPGVAPAKVVILGGGVAGSNAAQAALGIGADVSVLDVNSRRLSNLDMFFGGQIKTSYSNPSTIANYVKDADLLITAVLNPSARAPKLVSADMVKSMKKGSFIVMKTGTHPFISKLKLFFKWGISFPENSYTIADKGARRVHYISRETLIKNITARYPQEKKPRIPAANPPSGGQTMTEPAEATFAQEVNHAAQQEKIAKPIRTG